MKEIIKVTEFNFYYDESEHSRKINRKTINDENFYSNFTTTILGWSTSNTNISRKFDMFDEKWSSRKMKSSKKSAVYEFKSRSIKEKNIKKGFSSLNKNDGTLDYLTDFLDLFNEDIYVYYSVTSKLQYICQQFITSLPLPENLINEKLLVYSLTKAISQYKPKKVLNATSDDDFDSCNFTKNMVEFLSKQLDIDRKNNDLKEKEISNFQVLYEIFDHIIKINNSSNLFKHINKKVQLKWIYDNSFIGFKNYINEKNISDFTLFIDKEENTEKTAKKYFTADRCIGVESQDEFGVQMADMFAGLVTKLMRAVRDELKYSNNEDGINRKLISKEWFDLNNSELNLYHKLYFVMSKYNDGYYKTYSSIYSDDFIYLITLLEVLNKYNNINDLKENVDQLPNVVDRNAKLKLKEIFTLLE